jgi:type II secretory pathway component PulM
VQQYLQTLPTVEANLGEVARKVRSLPKPIITKYELRKLDALETAEAQKRGLEEFKFSSNEEMLQMLGLEKVAADSTD